MSLLVRSPARERVPAWLGVIGTEYSPVGCNLGIGLLLIYFVYGLAFWIMGLAVLLESGRASSHGERNLLHWLSAFGISHGTHEWLEAYLRVTQPSPNGLPEWLNWLRLSVLALSFICLLIYALNSLRQTPHTLRRGSWRLPVAVFALLAAMFAFGAARSHVTVPWTISLDAAARYLLAVPSALLASLAMWATARTEADRNRSTIASSLRLASIGFAIYAASQVIVHTLPWFPATVLNQDTFLSLTGIPIQVLRAVTAGVISVGLLRAMQAAEQDRQRILVGAHQARLAALVQQDALRRDLLRHMVRSQEDERSRIARELHDQVAQLLAAFSLELASLRSKIRRPETVAMVTRLQRLSRQMSDSLYQLVRDLRPSQLDNLGLVPALQALLGQEYGLKDLDVGVHVSGHARQLDGLLDTALFRVAQEALRNVSRHAHVSCAEVELQYDQDQVRLFVRDQGCGFDPAAEFFPPRGWGLAGMRERVEALGGRLDLHSSPSRGTTVEAIIPLPADPMENINLD